MNKLLLILLLAPFTFSLAPSVAHASLTDGLVGYWTFDGKDTNWGTNKTNDLSGQGNTGTMTSMSTTTSPIVGKIGQGLKFDGVSGTRGVNLGSPASLDLDTAYTLSAWVNTNREGSTAGAQDIMMIGGSSCCGIERSLKIVWSAAGGHYRFYYNTGSNFGNTTPKKNRWYHVVSTWDGAQVTLYVNGVIDATPVAKTSSTEFSNASSIGYGFSNTTFDGSIDDVRIYNRALSAGEIQQLYKQGAAKLAVSPVTSLKSSLVGYWTFDGKDTNWATNKTNDLSGQGNTGTLTSMSTTTSPVAGKIGQGLKFDGSDDYVTVTDNAVLDVDSTADLTMTGWFYRNTFTTDDTVIAKRNGITANDTGYIAYIDDTTDKLTFEVCSSGPECAEYQLESTTALTATGWYYFAIVWDQDSAANSEIYINGIDDNAIDTGVIGSVGALSNALAFRIGAESDNGNPFDGKLDDVRIYNRALSASEVRQLYNTGKSR